MNRSKTLLSTLILLLFITPSLSYGLDIPNQLRTGISVDEAILKVAIALQKDGWEYIMPEPKSAQARWGNRDGRTTWYSGYWKNNKNGDSSLGQPILLDGKYRGDGKGSPGWRRGGSPGYPTKIEWLLSKSGGVKPE